LTEEENNFKKRQIIYHGNNKLVRIETKRC